MRPMPRAFFLLLALQFLATLADNAFLIVAIGRVLELGQAAWMVPALKISYTLFYVLFAPFVGSIADAMPKGRVMVLAGALKLGASYLLCSGADPVLAIGLAGLGAAINAPAKYGLVTELLPARDLVRANGYFEAASVCAVILGTALGGLLISPLLPSRVDLKPLLASGAVASKLLAGMLVIAVLNAVTAGLSLGVAQSGARYARASIHPLALLRRFLHDNRVLWSDALGGLSMAVTTVLWAVGATLQLIVLRWASESLGLSLTGAAYLQVVSALGVVGGAIVASRSVRLDQAHARLWLGVLIGAAVPLLLLVHTVPAAAALLLLTGAAVGYFVIPLNALLQHRGFVLLTAGRSIAIQGFNENAGMLLLLAAYGAGEAAAVPLPLLIGLLGGLVTLGMLCVCLVEARRAVLRLPTTQGPQSGAGTDFNL